MVEFLTANVSVMQLAVWLFFLSAGIAAVVSLRSTWRAWHASRVQATTARRMVAKPVMSPSVRTPLRVVSQRRAPRVYAALPAAA